MRAPLADRMRPTVLADFVGQEELLGEGKFLSSVLSARPLPSLIFWGPPGSGKTTLARILARETDAVFLPYSAVLSGVKEIREALAELKKSRARGESGRRAARHPLHRRDPPVQQGAAGRPAPLRGGRHRHAVRHHDGEPVLRDPQRAAVALPGAGAFAAAPLPHRDDRPAGARPTRSGGWGSRNRSLSPDALEHIVAVADGDARVALNALEAAVSIALHKKLAGGRHGNGAGGAAQERAPVRQGRRGALQPDLRAPQDPCGAPTRTPPSTGSPGCSRPGKTRSTSRGG